MNQVNPVANADIRHKNTRTVKTNWVGSVGIVSVCSFLLHILFKNIDF